MSTSETNPEIFDDALVDALSKASMETFEKYQRMLTDVERSMIGTFTGIPDKFRDWVFYRCGLRSSAVSNALRHMMKQQGWQDAPKSVRHVGTELYDGTDGAEIIMAPQEVYRRQKDVEQRVLDGKSLRQTARKFDGLEKTLGDRAGVTLDEFSVDIVEGTPGDVASNVNDARARRLNKRP